jgi:hypothetical protein
MSEDLSSFFKLIADEKRKKDEEFKSVVGDLNLNDIFEEVSILKKKNKENKKKIEKQIKVFENFLYSEAIENTLDNLKISNKIDEIIEDFAEDLQDQNLIEEEVEEEKVIQEEVKEPTLIEKSLGLLSEPSDVKMLNDPLTPLDQNFATLEDLQNHYKLFLSRIQQQLSTLGGGGETRLEFLDDVNRDSVKVDHKFLRYDAPSKKWIGAYAGEAPFISSTTYITSSSYTITENDYYIGVNYAGAVTITLPTGVIQGTTYIVKDELGEASKGTNRYITILPSGSDKIDGRDRAILAYNFGSLTFVYRNGWRVV